MKTLSDYSIYCTESQAKKALELGAPILSFHNALVRKDVPHYYVGKVCSQSWDVFVLPTAEQMFLWLEEQGDIKSIAVDESDEWQFVIWGADGFPIWCNTGYKSRKEATLASIDAALEHIIKKQEATRKRHYLINSTVCSLLSLKDERPRQEGFVGIKLTHQ